ncbi:unnamed protein product, partial [Meganyctiphanes norvegica]
MSEPVLLKTYSYWKKIRKKKSPRTLMGPSDKEKVYLQKETENNQSKCEKVQRLKWPSHRKAKKIKDWVRKVKKDWKYVYDKKYILYLVKQLLLLILIWSVAIKKPPDKITSCNTNEIHRSSCKN